MLFDIFRKEAGSCHGGGGSWGGTFFVDNKAFLDGEFGGSGVIWIVYVVLVDDGVDHDRLFMNGQS